MNPFQPALALAVFLALFLSAPAPAFQNETGAAKGCAECHKLTKEEAAKDAAAAFYVMPYPRNRNDKATYRKCLAAVCSKSEKFLDDAYAGKELPAASCKSDAVDETSRLAERLKIEGTPTMILPDGRMIGGYMEAEALLTLLR